MSQQCRNVQIIKNDNNKPDLDEGDFSLLNRKNYISEFNLSMDNNSINTKSTKDTILKEENLKNSSLYFDSTSDLIKSSLIIESETHNSEKKSILSSLSSQLSNLKNNIKYNIVSTNTEIELKNLKYLSLFDSVMREDQCKLIFSSYVFKKIIYISYRSDFTPIVGKKKTYTSDCGWGCMIRAAQMLLAKGILENKIYQYKLQYSRIDLTDDDLNKFKFQTLALFFDNNIKIEEVLENEDFKVFFNSCSKILSSEENASNYSKRISSLTENILTSYDVFSKKSNDNPFLYLSEITPPFSIQNICKLGIKFEKGPGVWFSEVNMSEIFCIINKQLGIVKNLEFIHFKEALVNEEKILSECFYRNECDSCHKNLNSNAKISNCKECGLSFTNLMKKNNVIYNFRKGALILVSVRLGLDCISKEYIDSVRLLFKIPNNLGFIGGQNYSANYFIGEYMGKLIYIDPHYNNKSVKNLSQLLYNEEDFFSYTPKNFFITEVSNISPAFTLGLLFRSVDEYLNLIENLKIQSSLSHPILSYQESTSFKISRAPSEQLDIVDDLLEEYTVIEMDNETDDF